MFPANQRLRSCDLIIAEPVFGLIEYNKFMIFQCTFHAVYDPLFLLDLLAHLPCIKCIVTDIIAFAVLCRKVGTIVHVIRCYFLSSDQVNTKYRYDIKIKRVSA